MSTTRIFKLTLTQGWKKEGGTWSLEVVGKVS
jgi:hypothetical protein